MMAARSAAEKLACCNAASDGHGGVAKLAIGEAVIFAVAVGFDQADLVGKDLDGVFEGAADRLILGKIQHYRRD